MEEPLIVVGAAIVEGGLLLAAQRAHPAPFRGRWELPGGKVDPGESESEALARECYEELGARVRPRMPIGADVALSPRQGEPPAYLRVWISDLVAGRPRPIEHLALRWLDSESLTTVDWLPADLPFLDIIRPYLTPHAPAPEAG